MKNETLRVAKTGPVTRITLNRPQVLNALNLELGEEILSAMEAIEKDSNARVVVVGGAGNHFSSGGDIREMAETLATHPTRFFEKQLQVFHAAALRMRRSAKIYVASVQGHAAGAGLSLALGCDFRIVSETAKFTMAFIRLGLAPDSGATYLMTRLVGEARAKQYCLLGQTIDAREAERVGLVTRVVGDAKLEDATSQFATQLATGPPLALARVKTLVQASWDGILDDQLERETAAQLALGQTEDFQEGVRAFLEKRPALFKGR